MPNPGSAAPLVPAASTAGPLLPVRPLHAVSVPAPGRCPVRVDELRMLALLAEGLPMDGVARRMDLSDRTIRRRLRAMCDRLGASATIQVVTWAARNHWI